jgi:hypothetical protein
MKKLIMVLMGLILLSNIALAQIPDCLTNLDCAPLCCILFDPEDPDLGGSCGPCPGELPVVPEFSTIGVILAVAVIGIAAVVIVKKRK